MTHSGDHGFTLAEALMALLIISLALAGVMQAARMVGGVQRRLAADKKAEVSRLGFVHDLNQRLLPLQPIEGDVLVGDARTVRFKCSPKDVTPNCALRVPLGQLVYVSGGASHAAWPLPDPSSGFEKPRLEALIWRDAQGKSLAVIKFPVEHRRDCLFDMISRTCLEPDLPSSASAS